VATTLAILEQRLISRLRPDKTAPAITDVDNLTTEVVQLWANELSIEVIKRVSDPKELQALIVLDGSITLTAGVGDLPSDYGYYRALKGEITVNATTVKRPAKIYDDPAEFAKFDGNSFATSPPEEYPQALIFGDDVSLNPASITTAYLDYYKVHPTISSSQGTVWSDYADNVLLEMLIAKYYESHDDAERQTIAMQKAEAMLNG